MSRLYEGYTLEDFMLVVRHQYEHWAKDLIMCRYLRPETLFGDRFDVYLETAKLTERAKKHQAELKQKNEDETERIINERIAFFCHAEVRQGVRVCEA